MFLSYRCIYLFPYKTIPMQKTFKTIRKIWILFCFGMILTGCKKQISKYDECKFIYPIDIDSRNDISLFDLFDSVEIIPLETQKESLVAWGSPRIYKNRIYILENRLNIILCFDLNGKFLFRIDNIGQGPSEYQNLWTLSFDPFNDRLLLLETSGTLHEYTLDGHFIRKINPPQQLTTIHEVEAVNKDTLMYYTKFEQKKIHFYSRQTGQVVKNIYEEKDKLNSSPHFFNNNHQLYFLPSNQGNTVFNISNAKLEPTYFWDFGKHNYDPEKLKFPPMNEEEWKKTEIKWRLENIPYSFTEIYENNTYLYLLLNLNYTASLVHRIPPQQVHLFYNKHTGKYFIFNDFRERIEFGFTISMDDTYINCTGNFARKEVLLQADILKEKEKKILRQMKEDDNIYIIRFKFKQTPSL